jgi:hypothetical protein
MKHEEILPGIFSFLEQIGISVQHAELTGDCFLPGLSIENGVVLVDREHLKYPGDILHEAAHIAVVPPAERNTLNAKEIASRKDNAAEEMMAIAWSYAAAVHLGIGPEIVFHEDGYQGGGSHIAENFTEGRYFGVPMLQWVGMCADGKRAEELKVNSYPSMITWLRE